MHPEVPNFHIIKKVLQMVLNNLRLNLKVVNKDCDYIIEGINFKNSCFIEIFIDRESILKLDHFQGSFLVLSELKKSIDEKRNSYYLIFTSVTGVADSAGWEKIRVENIENNVLWEFYRDDKKYFYSFERSNIEYQINKIERLLKEKDKNCILEPRFIVYPE